MQQVAQQLGQDDQPTVSPAAALDDQRAEVGRGGAVSQALRVVVELPAAAGQIDARLRVLDHRTVLDVAFDRVASLNLGDHDIIQGLAADEGIGAHPVGGLVAGEALVNDVLDIGGGAGQPLQRAWRAAEGTVGRLRHGDARVARLLQQVDQAQGVARQ